MLKRLKHKAVVLAVSAALAASLPQQPANAAGIPVIDAAAIAQLVQQISYWQLQIQAMANQLAQLQASYQAITGSRGMESLMPISSQARNYLPSDFAELTSVLNNASVTYSGVAAQVQNIMSANAVLNRAQFGALSPQQQSVVRQGRESAAMLQMLAQEAQRNTSQRFGALQQLIRAIGTATDDKAIQDLQARIAAEQNMLTVEQTKLQALYQLAQAQEMQRQQMVQESAVQSYGSMTTARNPVFP